MEIMKAFCLPSSLIILIFLMKKYPPQNIIISYKVNYTIIHMRYLNNFIFQNQQHYCKVTWSMTSDIVRWWEKWNMLCGHMFDGTLDNKLTTLIFCLRSFRCLQSLNTLRFIKWSISRRFANNLSNKSKYSYSRIYWSDRKPFLHSKLLIM